MKKTARITGIFYLLLALIAPLSLMIMPSKLIVANDPTQTAMNILSQQPLFRMAIVGETFIVIIELVVLVLLYQLLNSVNKPLSLIAGAARLAMTVVQAINILFYLLTLDVLTDPVYASAFAPQAAETLATLLVRGHALGVLVWQFLFAFHLILLGLLVYKSGFFPKFLGILLLAASLGYLADSYVGILAPGNPLLVSAVTFLLIVSTIGEVVFTFWLLIKGLDESKLHAAA